MKTPSLWPQNTVPNKYCISVHPGAVAYFNAYFGRGSGPYHLNYVYCSGNETSLLNCSRGYSIGHCRPGNEAGVKCAIASSKSVVHLGVGGTRPPLIKSHPPLGDS